MQRSYRSVLRRVRGFGLLRKTSARGNERDRLGRTPRILLEERKPPDSEPWGKRQRFVLDRHCEGA